MNEGSLIVKVFLFCWMKSFVNFTLYVWLKAQIENCPDVKDGRHGEDFEKRSHTATA